MTELTLEKMQEAIDLVYPPLYYALSESTERGYVYLCKESDLNPEYIVCHPDDLQIIKDGFKNKRRLVPIQDEPIKKSMERVLSRLRRMT